METIQIDKICRACLGEDDKMIDMFEKDVYQKFLLFTNLPAEEIPDIPSNLCRSCEQKLNILLDFKKECQKSHEILLNYIKNTREVVSEPVVDAKNTFEVKLEATVADKLEVDSEATAVAVSNAKKSSRIEQFSQYQVWEAIKNLKQRFYKNRNCIRCNYVGNHLRALSLHISRVHKDLKLRWCFACNAEFDNLTDHVATNHSEDYTCKFCCKKFQSISHLTEHLHCHSDVKSFQCSFCDKCFIKQSYLNVHLNEHTKEKLYKCGTCKKSFTQLYQLHKHAKMHESEGNADKQLFVAGQNFCVECNKKVRSLLAHTREVHATCDKNGCNHSCGVCGKLFETAFKLKDHMRAHTREAPHKCKYCDKKLKTRNHLIAHEHTHTGEKPHVCQVCGKNFTQSSTLKTHMMLHVGPKISCKICNQKFCRPAQLHLHLRRHTGEKPYLCTECGRAFIQRSHLVEHTKTHSGLRPYSCSYCDKTFRQGSSLKHHVYIHSGEKPYKCNQCSYACRNGTSLTQHMKQHVFDKPQADRPHVCLICNRSFTTDAMLMSHINTHNVSFLDI